MLSIDIGKVNQGFAILSNDVMTIGLLNITERSIQTNSEELKNRFVSEIAGKNIKKQSSVVLQRGLVLKTFLNIVFDLFQIDQVIIERQSQNNPTAQEIEYMITGISLNRTEKITIYNPINKFTHVGLKYDTKNKAHKKLSVKVVSLVIEFDPCRYFFESLEKKDDVADAIYMLCDMSDPEAFAALVDMHRDKLV